jgi:hypothetical protein
LDNKSNEIKKYNKSLDIKSFLKNTEIQDVYIYGEAKVFNYYDILIFALYWNNLDLVSEKYKFVFEKYLSSLNSNDGKYYLPQSQNLYEIAYIIAPGNTQNMYV